MCSRFNRNSHRSPGRKKSLVCRHSPRDEGVIIANCHSQRLTKGDSHLLYVISDLIVANMDDEGGNVSMDAAPTTAGEEHAGSTSKKKWPGQRKRQFGSILSNKTLKASSSSESPVKRTRRIPSHDRVSGYALDRNSGIYSPRPNPSHWLCTNQTQSWLAKTRQENELQETKVEQNDDCSSALGRDCHTLEGATTTYNENYEATTDAKTKAPSEFMDPQHQPKPSTKENSSAKSLDDDNQWNSRHIPLHFIGSSISAEPAVYLEAGCTNCETGTVQDAQGSIIEEVVASTVTVTEPEVNVGSSEETKKPTTTIVATDNDTKARDKRDGQELVQLPEEAETKPIAMSKSSQLTKVVDLVETADEATNGTLASDCNWKWTHLASEKAKERRRQVDLQIEIERMDSILLADLAMEVEQLESVDVCSASFSFPKLFQGLLYEAPLVSPTMFDLEFLPTFRAARLRSHDSTDSSIHVFSASLVDEKATPDVYTLVINGSASAVEDLLEAFTT